MKFREQAVDARLKEDLDAAVQSGGIRLLGWTFGLLLLGLVVGLIPFEQVIEVPGAVRAKGLDPVVRASTSGVVKSVQPVDGQLVKVGDPLVALTTPALEADLQKAQSAEALVATTGQPADSVAVAQAGARLRDQESLLPLAEARIQRAKARLESQRTLVKDGLAPRQAVGAAEDEVDQALADRARIQQGIASARADLAAIQRQLSISGKPEVAALTSLQLQRDQMAVKADHAGRVDWIGVHSGQAVTAGQRLLRVSPTDADLPLEVVVLLPVDQLGSLRPGQGGRVALDGFEVGDYGFGQARLSHVGRDLLSEDQVRDISLAASVDHPVVEGVLVPSAWGRLKPEPGMTVRVWVVLGRRSLLSRLVSKLG